MSRRLPMFPLGMVLFPHALLPLHVFEERYRVIRIDNRGTGWSRSASYPFTIADMAVWPWYGAMARSWQAPVASDSNTTTRASGKPSPGCWIGGCG